VAEPERGTPSMTDFADALASFAADLLQPGERLLAAVRGRARDTGAEGGRSAEPYVGKIGSVLGPKIPRPRPSTDPRTGLPSLPPLLDLGLTDRRVLVFARGAITGRTRRLTGLIPRDRVHRLELDAARLPFGRDRLTIHLVDGAPLTVEVARATDTTRFVDAFHAG
jgi:hypothetical protein